MVSLGKLRLGCRELAGRQEAAQGSRNMVHAPLPLVRKLTLNSPHHVVNHLSREPMENIAYLHPARNTIRPYYLAHRKEAAETAMLFMQHPDSSSRSYLKAVTAVAAIARRV